ncbi:hypothetical protein MKW98_026103 [Papaver atlanticum]|uniref:Histidine decarboxylase n=1 Tax=Papaver atlanticum TaxID=357466 RepID=A0AAD4X5N1_9MAGN|nr:hypothetical protein MKW98_026103 [Papaver atlanticum]
MVGSVGVGARLEVSTSTEINGEIEYLPEDLVPVVLAENNEVTNGVQMILPYAVTEPEADDEITGEREAYMASILEKYKRSLVERTKHQLGYPTRVYVNYGALSNLQHFCINNCGSPFIESAYSIHSRQFEVGVLDWFARLWGIQKDEYWGYVTTGGTEGNFHGILVGRELFPDGILYTSEDSHYSVFRAAQMYRMNYVKVDSLISGEIDCTDFKAKLLLNKNKPVVGTFAEIRLQNNHKEKPNNVMADSILNISIHDSSILHFFAGTTVKGAIDDLDRVIKILKTTGFGEDRFYIHCDGALIGLMMPFVKRAPKISFEKPIGSVCISGHKFLGCPVPCGVHITRLNHIKALSRNIEYIGCQDATLMGSRSGHAPIFLWYALNQKGHRGLQKEVQMCLKNAQYLKERLHASRISVMLNEFSNIVVFEKPRNEEFILYWQLAVQGNLAHVVVMPNITVAQLDEFVRDLAEKRAIWLREGKHQPFCAADVGKENCACPRHQ